MIGKHVSNSKHSSGKSGRVTGLTNYITAPENKNELEKCVYSEAIGFYSDNLKSQQIEMIALATTAVRSKDPIDHYVLSWQEGERPTIEQAKEAVEMTLSHLGLAGHQVIWGMHDDTANMHIHIAVNRVNPETLKVVEINNGFQRNAIQQAAAIVEKQQGWKVHEKARFRTDELGHLITEKGKPKVFKPNEPTSQPKGKVRDQEIQTGEKSATRIGIEHAPAIIASATSWADLHAKLQAAGMEYMRQGSGAAIKIGETVVKASDIVDRKNNFGALQKRFGLYQPPDQPEIKNDPLGRTKLITDDRFTTGFDEPNTPATGFSTTNGLLDLSSRDLASGQTTAQTKTKNKGLLQFDESARRGRTDRVRRGSDSPDATTAERRTAGATTEVDSSHTASGDSRTNRRTERIGPVQSAERHFSNQYNKRTESGKSPIIFHQRLNNQQHGWEQYQQIKKENDLARNAERLALQKRHEAERSVLFKSQKERRETELKKVPKGNGAALNVTRSLLAIEQAPQKLELQERQRAERKAFFAKYKPLPMYKIWKKQPLIFAPIDALHIEPRETQISVSRTLRALTSTVDRYNNVTYQLAKKDVFRDEGRTIQILDLNSNEGIAAAIAVAQQKFGNVLTLTGSPEFQRNAVAVAVANNLTCKFLDPDLDKLRDELQQQKYQAERSAELLEKSKKPEKVSLPPEPLHSPSNNQEVPAPSPIQQTGEAEALNPKEKEVELVVWLAKYQDVPKATSAQVRYGTVKEICGSVALLHIGQGRHVIHDFGAAQAVPPVGRAAGQKSGVERG